MRFGAGRITTGRMPIRGGPGEKALLEPAGCGPTCGRACWSPAGGGEISPAAEAPSDRSSIISGSAEACDGARGSVRSGVRGEASLVLCTYGIARGSPPSSPSSNAGAGDVMDTGGSIGPAEAAVAAVLSGWGCPAGGLRRDRPRGAGPATAGLLRRARGLASPAPAACSPPAVWVLVDLPRPRPPRDPRLRGFRGAPSVPPPPPASSGLLKNIPTPNTDTPTLETRSVTMIAPICLSRPAASSKSPLKWMTPALPLPLCLLPIPCDLHPERAVARQV